MEHAFHVAFVANASLIIRVPDALRHYEQSGDSAELAVLLTEAHAQRWTRRNQQTSQLDRSIRARLTTQLAQDHELVTALSVAPMVVRQYALARSTALSNLLCRLRELNAPPVVVESTRSQLLRAVLALDPAQPLAADPPAEIGVVDTAVDGERLNLHDWLGALLDALFDPLDGLRGLGRSISTAAELPPTVVSAEGASGIEFTSYGFCPDDPLWRSPAIGLPRALYGQRVVVVGVSGGPATFALPGDKLDLSPHPALAAQLARLDAGHALVSFVGIENDTDWPWQPSTGL